MTANVSKKTKKLSKKPANQQSSKKSLSKSSIVSENSNPKCSVSKGSKSLSSKHSRRGESSPNVSSFTQIDKKDDITSKTIYKTSEDSDEKADKNIYSFTYFVMSILQSTIFIYILFTIIYQMFLGEPGDWMFYGYMYLLEACLVYVIFELNPKYGRNNQPTACLSLSLQYVLLFVNFSFFLTSSDDCDRSLFARIFGLPSVTFFSSSIHFFIIIQSIELLGESKSRNDFSDEIIVEGLEKRRKSMEIMINELIDEIVKEDGSLKVYFTIKDETGRLKSMRGSNVEAEVVRNFEMKTNGNRIDLSRSTTTVTCVDAPKQNKKKNTKNTVDDDVVYGPYSKFNACFKQEKTMSSRKIL